MLLPVHLQARELCPQTYSLSLPLEWSQVTHIPASIKLCGAFKPENSAFYSTFARQLCDDTRLPGWLSAFPVHSHSSPLRQALHTQIANPHIQRARKSSFFLSVVLEAAQLHESAARPVQRGTGHIKGTHPLVVPVAAMGKCKRANKFQLRHYSHPISFRFTVDYLYADGTH